MKVGGESKVIKFKKQNGEFASGVNCKYINESDSKIIEIIPDNSATIITLKPTQWSENPIALNCSAGSLAGTINISKVDSERDSTTLKITGSIEPKKLNLLVKQTLDLTVAKNVELKKSIETDAITLSKKNENTWTITGNKNIGDKDASELKLLALSSGKEIPINELKEGIPVRVGELELLAPNQKIGKERKLLKDIIKINNGLIPTTGLKLKSSNPALVEVSGSTFSEDLAIVGKSAANYVSVIISDGNNGFSETFFVSVNSSPQSLKIAQNGVNEMMVGNKIDLSAFITNDEGLVIPGEIQWSLEDASDSEYVSMPLSGQTVSVLGLKVPVDNKPIRIVAKVKDSPIVLDRTVVFVIGKRNVVGFQPIDVRIDMLDERTAKDLFGGPASKEYHIAKIRIVNELDQNQNGGPASSVLFFSDALEVQVSLEKQAMENGGKRWDLISREDVLYINNWKSCPNDKIFNQSQSDFQETGYQVCDLEQEKATLECRKKYPNEENANDRLLCENNAKARRIQCKLEIDNAVTNCSCPDGDNSCQMRCKFCDSNDRSSKGNDLLGSGQYIPFRPFVYQAVANTHDRRTGRSKRSLLFLGANMLGTAVSFGTSFLVPKPSSDLPIFLEKYQNLLIPAAEKLFPSLREVERQNIISMVLPPIVEVPFGTDVSKYVFFPKKSIYGVLPKNKVRISSISSYNIKVRVGIVQKQTVKIN